MITKICTDIDQSKKLAEILPIKSADMYWLNWHIDLTDSKYEVFVINKSNKYIDFFNSYAVAIDNNEIIPCWSLAALLDALPKGEYKDTDLCFGGYKGDEYISEWVCSYEQQEPFIIKICYAPNPIDACYKMIIKLHEQKLL